MGQVVVMSAHGETTQVTVGADVEAAIGALVDWLDELEATDWTADGQVVHAVMRVDGEVDREANGALIRAVYGLPGDGS